MAFLGDDDVGILEATLSFVDEYPTDILSPTEAPALVSTLVTHGMPLVNLPVDGASNSLPNQAPHSFGSITTGIPAEHQRDAGPAEDRLDLPSSKRSQTRRKSAKPRKPQANPNRARNELRFELVYLREKVEQLQSELHALQLNSQSNSHRGASLTLGPATPEISVWAGVAKRQRGRREEAERENVRLRLIVERQRKVATDLSNLLRKRVNQQVSEFSHFEDPKIAEHRLIRVLDFHGDIGDFQGLFQHLDAAYNEVDTVFAANGLAAMVVPPDNVHIREGADGKYLEFCASKTLPFAVRATSEAAWNHFSGVGKHFGNGGLYEKAAKNLDEPYTIIEDFTKELYSNSSRADMKAKQVLRRYVEPDRDIIVLVSRVTAAEVKHKALPGMTYHLRVYAVTSRSPASTPENEMSMLQFCSCISLDIESGAAFDPTSNEIRALNKFLIGNTVGNIRSYQERIENALVDQALKSQLQSITI